MAMLKSLLYVRLMATLDGLLGKNKEGKATKGRVVGMSLVYAMLILTFGIFFFGLFSSTAAILVSLGLYAEYFGIVNIASFSIVFILSIFETKSELFDCKDNELLLSMPVRPINIIISRSLIVLCSNAVEVLFITVPAVTMYIIFGGNAWHIPTAVLSALFMAIFATALACGVGYIVALISRRFKNNTFVTVLASLVFIAAYFFGYSSMMGALEMMENVSPEEIVAALAGVLRPISYLGMSSAPSLANPVSFLLLGALLILSLGSAFLAWYIISKNYISIITKGNKSAGKVYKGEHLVASGAFLALVKKEISLFFSSSAYILNSSTGIIFSFILSIFALISREEVILTIAELGMQIGIPTDGALAVAVVIILVSFAAFNSISASALSMEGKRFWIMRSAPVDTMYLAYAKLAPHLLVTAPASLVCSILLGIAFGESPMDWIVIILIPQLANLVFAILGLLMNIVWHKFDFENDVQVVKQSLPVFLSMLAGMIMFLVFAAVGGALLIFVGALVAELIMLALILIMFIILYIILIGPAKAKLEKIKP